MISTVLAFPGDRVRPVMPEIRLARALDKLAAALAEQHAAVQAWRASLHRLKAASDGIGGSLMQYQDELTRLSVSVARLDGEARRLQAPCA